MEVTPLSHCTLRDGGTAEYVTGFRPPSTVITEWLDRQPQRADAIPLAPDLAATMEAIYLKDHP